MYPREYFDTFWREGIAQVPARGDNTYLADFRENPAAHALPTESGKIVLGSKTLAALGYDDCLAHPAFIPPAELLQRMIGRYRLENPVIQLR